jgi:hypothetical protein
MEILGIAISAAVAAPNLLLLTATPTDLPLKRQVARGGAYHRMELVERVGQIATFAVPLWFKFDLSGWLNWTMFVVMGVSLAFYYAGWIRFVRSGSRYREMFAPMLDVPIPMALAPITYFAAAAVGMRSWQLGVALALMALGHVYVSWSTWQYLLSLPASEGR